MCPETTQDKERSEELSGCMLFERWRQVFRNQHLGAEKDLRNNLYKLWNRMAPGSYHPKSVKGVEIPKKNGKMRLLGIPTIKDRVS